MNDENVEDIRWVGGCQVEWIIKMTPSNTN